MPDINHNYQQATFGKETALQANQTNGFHKSSIPALPLLLTMAQAMSGPPNSTPRPPVGAQLSAQKSTPVWAFVGLKLTPPRQSQGDLEQVLLCSVGKATNPPRVSSASAVQESKAICQQPFYKTPTCALEPRRDSLTQLPRGVDSSPAHPLIMNRPAGSKSLRGKENTTK